MRVLGSLLAPTNLYIRRRNIRRVQVKEPWELRDLDINGAGYTGFSCFLTRSEAPGDADYHPPGGSLDKLITDFQDYSKGLHIDYLVPRLPLPRPWRCEMSGIFHIFAQNEICYEKGTCNPG